MACSPKPPARPEDTCRLLKPRAEQQSAACPDAEFRVGNYQITYSLGCVRKSRVSHPIPDGWYNRVRIEDGQIVDVDNEEDRVTLLPDMCVSQGAGSGGALQTTDSPCNLSTISGNTLSTRIVTNVPGPQDIVWLDGCGSEGFPLKAGINVAMLREALGMSVGANVQSCGISIQGGSVVAFPNQVITGVRNLAQGVLEAYIDENCQLVLAVPGYSPGTGSTTPNYQATRPCQSGTGTITFGVYQGEQGRFYLRVVAGGPSFTPNAPGYFETLAAAQAFIATAVGICSDPTGDPGGA